jgi:hypothetical protein
MVPKCLFKAGFGIKYYQKSWMSEGKSANSEFWYTFFDRVTADKKIANNEGHLYFFRSLLTTCKSVRAY